MWHAADAARAAAKLGHVIIITKHALMPRPKIKRQIRIDDMPSNKIRRINEDVMRELSSLIRNVKDPRVRQGMISITRADVTGDLRYCKVYLSVLGEYDEKELIRGLKSASGYLRRGLGEALDLRYTPELIFEIDKSIEHGAHISKLLGGLDTQGKGADDHDDK